MQRMTKEGKYPGIYSYTTNKGIRNIYIKYYANGKQHLEKLGQVKLGEAQRIRVTLNFCF